MIGDCLTELSVDYFDRPSSTNATRGLGVAVNALIELMEYWVAGVDLGVQSSQTVDTA
jgi:hypothetical protein